MVSQNKFNTYNNNYFSFSKYEQQCIKFLSQLDNGPRLYLEKHHKALKTPRAPEAEQGSSLQPPVNRESLERRKVTLVRSAWTNNSSGGCGHFKERTRYEPIKHLKGKRTTSRVIGDLRKYLKNNIKMHCFWVCESSALEARRLAIPAHNISFRHRRERKD